MAVDLTKLERLYNNAPSATYQPESTNVQNGIDMDKLTRLYNNAPSPAMTTKGQINSVPVVASGSATPTTANAIQQQNYDRIQGLFNRTRESDAADLARVNDEILAISGYGAGADRSKLQSLLQQKDQLEQRLKTGRYDEDLTALERVQLTAQGIGESLNYTPDVLIDTATQAYRDRQANKGNADYLQLREQQKDTDAQIALLERRAMQGVLDNAGFAQLAQLRNLKKQQESDAQQYRTPLNINSDSVQGMRRAMQAQQQATYGMGDTAAFLYNTGASIAENASLMPLAMLPGGQTAILAIMGAKSAAQKAVEVGESGGTAAEALVRGLSSGLIESATEKLPLDNLVKIAKGSTGKAIIKNILKQAGEEGTEEAVSYIANSLVDMAALDPNAKFSIAELLMAFGGGALSGGVMGTGAEVIGRRKAGADINDGSKTVENKIDSTESEINSTESEINSTESEINSTENAVLQPNAKDEEKEALIKKVQEMAGVDARTETEKVTEEQQSKIAAMEDLVSRKIAPQEHLDRVKQSAEETIAETKAKESLDSAVKLIEHVGKEADVYSDSRDRAAAYNTAKRIGINLAHSDTTAMGRAVHEVGHDKTQSKQWQNYTAALDRLIATDGRLVKLMDDIDYAYRNNEDSEIRASVSFADGTIDNAKVRNEQYLKLTEIMLPNIAKGDKQLLEAIKKDRNVIDNLLDFIRGIKNKVSIKLTKSEAAMLDEAERQLVNLLRSEGAQTEEKQYSYGGTRASNPPEGFLRADRLAEFGTDNEEIRQETGWFKGADGKWRFEIDDSKMQIDVTGKLHRNPDIRKEIQLFEEVYVNEDMSKLEELQVLQKNLKGVNKTPQMLGDIVSHPDLFKHYPELANMKVEFKEMPAGHQGGVDMKAWRIVLNKDLKSLYATNNGDLKKTLIHEIQHCIQRIEGFAGGANVRYWEENQRKGNMQIAKKYYEKYQKAKDAFLSKVYYKSAEYAKLCAELETTRWNTDEYDAVVSKIGEKLYEDFSEDKAEKLLDEVLDWGYTMDLYKGYSTGTKDSPRVLYLNTAGERESRDVESRLNYTSEQRQSRKPDTGDNNIVFVRDTGYSEHISDTAEQQIDDALVDKNYRQEIKLRDFTPQILVEHGVKDLPMLMKASHLRENIFTEQEAAANGLSVNKNINYHGLGKELFMQVIDSLDNPQRVYRGTKQADNTERGEGYFLIISTLKDSDGNSINVPVYIEQKGRYNNIVVDANKIATVFGKNNINNYINREIKNKNLVKINKSSKKSNGLSPIDSVKDNTASVNRITQFVENSNGNNLLKEKQLEIITNANPMTDNYHTGIRSVDDILTAEEAFAEDNFGGTPDWTQSDADKALSKGKVTVYSSYPIENGVFVTPSKMEARSYAGSGKVYNKTVLLNDVAWIDSEQGQYATVEETSYSLQTDIDTNEYWGENSKSRAVERHAVNEFTNYVAELLGVEYKDKTEILKKQAWKLADAAKKTGMFNSRQMIDFFNDAYNMGKQEIGNLDERNKQLKKELRNLGIKPLKGREYLDFVQKYKGKIIFNNKGMDIDVAYKQLAENYPEWFSEDITKPYDMMRAIGDVYDSIQGKKVSNTEYFGKDAEAFKNAAFQQYSALVDNFIDTMNSVSRYQLALGDQKAQKEAASKKVYTIEDVKAARELAQPLMKEIARMDRKNLFTAEDRNRLDKLLELTHPADIERMQESLRETNPLAEDIIEMYEKKKMLEAVQKPIFEYNKQRKARLKEQFLSILQTSDSWKDKGSGLAYMNNTFERNIDDIVTDKKAAEELKDILPRQIHKHVADATRYKNKLRDKIRGFNIDTKKVYNIEVTAAGELLKGEATEADLIQMYGEGIVTKQYLDKIGANTKKIVETADKFREIYNELFEKINEAYVANGYAPIEYRQDYFPHFFDETGDTLLNKVGQFLGFDAKNMLPTEIAGRTHEFSPGRQWNSHALQRKGEKTDYNVLKGFDNYIEAAANIIHLTEDIQNLRAFESAIRYKYSDEGMKAELDAIDGLPIAENEKQEQREKILKTEDRSTKLNNFVVWEHEYTNILAGKKSKADRWIEDMFGRRFYTVAKNIENRVSANMIAGNISSAITNIIPITQLTAEVDLKYIATAMSDTMNNLHSNDGFVDMSDFLTNRFGSEMLSLTTMQKLANKAGKPMELVDEFTSNVVTRARYLQNLNKNGMDSGSAIKEADEYAAKLMADRSKGALPVIFESKNPLIKLFTMFQVEQNNQLQYFVKDLPKKMQGDAKKWIIWGLIKASIFAALFNALFRELAGREPALSPIDLAIGAGKDIAAVKKGEMKASAAMSNAFVDVMENLPYVGSVLAVTGLSEDAGRIPVSGALPDFSQLFKIFDREVSAEKKKAVAKKELAKPAFYLAAPFAGGTAKRLVETKELYGKNKGVQYSIQSDGSKKVQFANDPSVGAVAQSAVFGKWASKPAQEYINSGFKGLTKGQTENFELYKSWGMSNKEAFAKAKESKAMTDKQVADMQALTKAGMSESDAYMLVTTYKEKADTDKNNSLKTKEAVAYIEKLDLTMAQKAILFSCMCPTVKNNPYK